MTYTKAEKELYDLGYTNCRLSVNENCEIMQYVHNQLTNTYIEFRKYNDNYKIVNKHHCSENAPLELEEIIAVNDRLEELGWLSKLNEKQS